MEYERLPNGTLQHQTKVGDHVVTLRASDVRKERTGIHADVAVFFDTTIMAEDAFNVGRHPERTRLANAAFKTMQPSLNGAAYENDDLHHELLLFCRGLWNAQVGSQRAEPLAGDATPSLVRFLVQHYVIEGAGTLLFAPPGRGKSWTGMLMAVSVDVGSSLIWNVQQAPVLYINLERSAASMARRLGVVNASLNLDATRPLRFINARGRSLSDVIEGAQRTVQEDAIGLVVLDSLSRSGAGDLTENAPANKSMDLLNGLGCAWMALAHTPRGDESHVYGSQMFDAAADLGVQMLTEDGPHGDRLDGYPTLGIGLKVAKANDTAKPPLRIWAYEFDRDYGLANVRPAEAGEFPQIEGTTTPISVEDQIVNRLLRGSMTNQELAAEFEVSESYMSKLTKPLRASGRIASVSQEGNSKKLGIPDGQGRSQSEFPS